MIGDSPAQSTNQRATRAGPWPVARVPQRMLIGWIAGESRIHVESFETRIGAGWPEFEATDFEQVQVLVLVVHSRADNLVLVKFGFSALSVPRFFGV